MRESLQRIHETKDGGGGGRGGAAPLIGGPSVAPQPHVATDDHHTISAWSLDDLQVCFDNISHVKRLDEDLKQSWSCWHQA